MRIHTRTICLVLVPDMCSCVARSHEFCLYIKPDKKFLPRLMNATAHQRHTERWALLLYCQPHAHRRRRRRVLCQARCTPARATTWREGVVVHHTLGTFDNTTVVGVLEYEDPNPFGSSSAAQNNLPVFFVPILPQIKPRSSAASRDRNTWPPRRGTSTGASSSSQGQGSARTRALSTVPARARVGPVRGVHQQHLVRVLLAHFTIHGHE